MSHPADPDDVSSQRSTQQSTEGDKNQVIGEVVESTIYHISDTGHITINQAQNLPSIAETIKAQPLIQRSPYLGLRKFEVRDKDLFFGRDQLISRLLSRLQETPFLLILGASGSGKSSLVRAGLIPNLSHVLGTGFRELIFTPDRDPFDSFRSSLRSAGFRQADLESLQTGQPETIVQVVRSLKSADEDWLIFIDQFEELFTLCQNLQQRQAFVNGLIQLVQSELPSLRLVLAMRADFLDRLGAYPQLTGILQRSELITDMGNDELRLAIEKPAAHHGVVLEPELTEEVIHDLKGRPDTVSEAERVSLPLLQYTLKLLWENSEDLIRDRTLRVSTYRSLGGVRGALQRHVDEIYAPLPDEQKQAAKHIFLQLVDVTSADAGTTAVGKAVSRRAALSEFSPAEQEVLRRLVDAGLLVSDDPETHAGLLSPDTPSRDRKATVELAHETLIDAWDTLKAWIEESRPLIRTKNQLREDAHRWHEMYQTNRAQAEAELWQGRKLQWLLSQKQEIEARFGQFKSKELQFIEACEELCDRQRRAELKRQEKQKKLYRRIAAGATTSLFLVTSMAIVALHQWRAAERGQLEALIASSEANFQLHPGSLDALIDAIKAGHQFQQSFWLKHDADLRQSVMEVLGQALYQAREYNRLKGHSGTVSDLSFNPTQQSLITVSYDSTVRIWNMNGEQERMLTLPDQYLTGISISPNGKILAVTSYEGIVSLINLNGEQVAPPIKGHEGAIRDIAFSSDGQVLSTVGDDGTLRFWKATGEALEDRTLNTADTKFSSIAFSKDGKWITAGKDDGSVIVLDNEGNAVRTLAKHVDRVSKIAFSPDSQSIATSSYDKKIIVWDLNTGEIRSVLEGHLDEVASVAFSPDGMTLASSSYDGEIKIWTIQGKLIDTLKTYTSGVFATEFNSDGNLLASSSEDGTVQFWKISSEMKVLADHTTEIFSVNFNSKGDKFASSDLDGNVILWNTQGIALETYSSNHGFISKVQFSPDNTLLATGNIDGTVTLLKLANFSSIFSNHKLTVPSMPGKAILGIDFNPNSQTLAVVGESKAAQLWNRKENKISTFFEYSTILRDISWNADGKIIGVAAEDGTVHLFNLNNELINAFQAHSDKAYRIVFDPVEPNIFATSGQDAVAKIWQMDGQLLHTLKGHKAGIWDIQFSPDGKSIATASDDGTIKLWTDEGELIVSLVGHKELVNAVGFGLDGNLLVSGSSDRTVRIWNISNLSLESWLIQGCSWIQDYLNTNDETSQDICT